MIEQHGSLAEKFLKKGFWLYFFSFIVAPTGYIIKIIISNELSVSEVGILYGIISLIVLISAYNDLWMSESLKHFVPKYLAEKNYTKVKSILLIAIVIQISTAIIAAAIFYFWSNFLAQSYFQSENAVWALKVFALFFIGFNVLQSLTNFFLSIQDTFYSKLGDSIRMFWTMILVIFLLFTDAGTLTNFSIAQVFWVYIWCISAIISFYYLYYKKYFINVPVNFDRKHIYPILKYALLIVMWTSAGTILSQVDMQMIIYFLGTNDAWYYTNYLSIIGIQFMIIGPIFTFLFPVIAELHGKWDIQKIASIKKIFSDIFISVGIMFNVFFFVFAEAIAYTLFWEKFINSWTILQYSILFLTFNFLLQINFNLQAGVGNIKSNVQITIAAMFLNIITNIIFIQLLWVYGAALATWLWWIFMLTLSHYAIKKEYRSSYWLINIIKNIIIFIISWLLFWNISQSLDLYNSRFISFGILWFLFIVWLWIFVTMNYTMFKKFILEIKKLKWKRL